MDADRGGMDSYDKERGHVEPAAHPVTSTAAAPRPTEPAPAEPATAAAGATTADAAPAAGDPDATDPDAGAPGDANRPRAGIAGLSLPYQVVASVAVAVVAVFACYHVAMVFLHVAPSNTLTKQHGEAVDEWVFPEFEQNWKLFAPNPLQQNIAVHARAEVIRADGSRRTTDWIDLSADDGEAIRGNLAPSHVDQNQLRRGWDFYANSHTADNRANGMRGRLSERYIRRITMLRLEAHDLGGRVDRIQVRSSTRAVGAPPWSEEKTDTRAYYRTLPWWTVTAADLPAGVDNGRTEAQR
ncbi:DUF5819 family protein [Streptomyces sp. NPDC093546]|uniref:DUF5819 family protein n=1 Tax=Streptomyces sp. NPDC093546 TaxID=3366040 RepID=UPI003800A87E